jgi:hypothetical protein
MFDLKDILQLGIDRLAEKIIYFNDYYIYRTGIDTRMPDSESNEININIAEYANVLDDRFNIFINLNIDNFLVLMNGDEDWLSVFNVFIDSSVKGFLWRVFWF